MDELIKQLETDWGASGAQWSGQQVQDYIKKWFRAISEKLNTSNGDTEEPEEDDVTLKSINEALKKLQNKVTAFLGEEDASSEKSIADAIKYLQSSNTVSTVESIPTNKRLVIASISESESFSLAKTLENGEEIHIIVKNTSDSDAITITLPNDGGYVCLVDSALSIEAESIAEINVISDGTDMYIRAI